MDVSFVDNTSDFAKGLLIISTCYLCPLFRDAFRCLPHLHESYFPKLLNFSKPSNLLSESSLAHARALEMKGLVSPSVLAVVLLLQPGLGQQSCFCTSMRCSCPTANSSSADGSDSGPALVPGNPPMGSRDFLTPDGNYQPSPAADKPIQAGNQQQYIWAGAAMISSSDNAIVLVRSAVLCR